MSQWQSIKHLLNGLSKLDHVDSSGQLKTKGVAANSPTANYCNFTAVMKQHCKR